MHKPFASEHTVQHTISYVFLLFLVGLLTSCASVKNPPKNQPFVYDTQVDLDAEQMNNEEKRLLQDKLYEAIDDSLQVNSRQILGFTQRINPPVFDSGNVRRSVGFMNGFLNSAGYYHASFDTFTVRMDSVYKMKRKWRGSKKKEPGTEIRAYTKFYVSLGKKLRVDTLAYSFQSAILQHLADSSKGKAILRKDDPYSKDAIGAELDRLASIFRKNGFLKMSRSTLLAEADTTDPSLISMNFDPIQQLLEAQRRLEDPRIKLRVFERPNIDTTAFEQYYVDSVFIYPETKITEDPDQLIYDTSFTEIIGNRAFIIRQRNGDFRPSLIRRFNYIRRDQLYDETGYFKTVNNFYNMGPWQQVDVRTHTFHDSVPKVNFHLFLYPNKRQNFQLDLEGSQNNNISVSNTLSGRFFALSLNGTLRNRNLFRAAIQSVSTIRYGFELNNRVTKNERIFQTLIVAANQSFTLPRMIWPMSFLDRKRFDAGRTKIDLGGAFTERFEFYKQIAFNGSLQWEWKRGRSSYSVAVPNFESVSITPTDSLIKVILLNPSLIYAFTPGNILSIRGAWEHTLDFSRHPRSSGFFRLAGEWSPLRFNVFNRESFRFVKTEGQFVYRLTNRRTSWNYRAYGGIGWDISGRPGATLPYFRQYIAGGSNSMRAWGLRQLGVGYSISSDTAGFTDRFADIQLEFNAEYRFRLFRLFGFDFAGAVFADCGNIWAHDNFEDGYGKFYIKNLYRDLALDMGLGVRWDFNYLVVRLDAGYKLKDPVREGDGWIKQLEWKSTNRLGTRPRNNVGFQFGIGYPF